MLSYDNIFLDFAYNIYYNSIIITVKEIFILTRDEHIQLVKNLLKRLKKSAGSPLEEYEIIFLEQTNWFFEKYLIRRFEIKNFIKDFTIYNHLKGPEDDEDPSKPGKVWVFGFELNNQEMYIKFREYKNKFICFRIHPSKQKNKYTFR